MGYRTVVVLNNDYGWDKDPNLAEKINRAANLKGFGGEDGSFRGGKVLECVHADAQTVVILDSCSGTVVAQSYWHRGETEEQRNERLLREFADKLGFRVVKKSKKVQK